MNNVDLQEEVIDGNAANSDNKSRNSTGNPLYISIFEVENNLKIRER